MVNARQFFCKIVAKVCNYAKPWVQYICQNQNCILEYARYE